MYNEGEKRDTITKYQIEKEIHFFMIYCILTRKEII